MTLEIKYIMNQPFRITEKCNNPKMKDKNAVIGVFAVAGLLWLLMKKGTRTTNTSIPISNTNPKSKEKAIEPSKAEVPLPKDVEIPPFPEPKSGDPPHYSEIKYPADGDKISVGADTPPPTWGGADGKTLKPPFMPPEEIYPVKPDPLAHLKKLMDGDDSSDDAGKQGDFDLN